MRVNIDCSLILLLLSGMLALLKIGGQFPYSWIWVIAPIWIPLLALAGIKMRSARVGRMVFRASQRSRIGGQLATHCVKCS